MISWLRGAAVAALCFLIAACSGIVPPSAPVDPSSALPSSLPPAGLPNGVAAGDVTQEMAVLWARAAAPGLLTFTVETGGVPIGEPVTRTVTNPLRPVTVTVTGLTPATTYHYTVTVSGDGPDDGVGDQMGGRFRTPAADGERQGLRFGASGDVRGDLAPYPAIANAPGRDLDFFVHLGDTVYADFPSPAVPKQAQTPEEFLQKYVEVHSTYRGSNTLAALRAATPFYVTLDDHEVLNNFAGGALASSSRFFAETNGLINETRLYRAGLDAFLAYHPLQIERYESGDRTAGRPKIYRYRTFGADAALFVLDMRSFRDAPLSRARATDDPETIARFMQDAFAPERTMLGEPQLNDLRRDLLDAQQRGITWKFIISPDPIQQFELTAAQDRWQGYAAERTALLRFIAEQGITNVVFITAEIHGMVVNNLAYQEGPDAPLVPLPAWEIAVGPVAAHPPHGLAIFLTYLELGVLDEADQAEYEALPVRHDPDDIPDDRDDYVRRLLNQEMARFGYDPIGLEGAPVDAELLEGDYLAGHVYGWTEFEIDPASQALTVTTYGILAYDGATLNAQPQEVLARTPAVVSRFVVRPSP